MIVNLGDASFKAFITVTYITGTITVAHESGVTYTHSGGGTQTLTVKKKGKWTVTCVVGDRSETVEVTVSYRGQVASVSITLTQYSHFYNRGTQSEPWSWGGIKGSAGSTGNPEESTGQYGKVTFGADSMRFHRDPRYSATAVVCTAYTTNKILLTDLKKLYVVTKGGSSADGYSEQFGVGTVTAPDSIISLGTIVKSTAIAQSDSEKVTELDVSSVTGSHQIFIQYIQLGMLDNDLYVYEVYGE